MVDRFGTVARVRTFIVGAVLGIGPHYQKIAAGFDQPMSRAGRQDDHVARLDGQYAALDAAQLHLGRAKRNAQNLVDL